MFQGASHRWQKLDENLSRHRVHLLTLVRSIPVTRCKFYIHSKLNKTKWASKIVQIIWRLQMYRRPYTL